MNICQCIHKRRQIYTYGYVCVIENAFVFLGSLMPSYFTNFFNFRRKLPDVHKIHRREIGLCLESREWESRRRTRARHYPSSSRGKCGCRSCESLLRGESPRSDICFGKHSYLDKKTQTK